MSFLNRALRSTLFKQGAGFIVVGLAQLAVDFSTFVLLSYMGVGVVIANVVARFMGAASGYSLNGLFTFSSHTHRSLHLVSACKFVIAWLCLTGFGTFAIVQLRDILHSPSWVIKLLVESVLALVSFLAMRLWVFAHRGIQIEEIKNQSRIDVD